jgi:hypothetical protein
MVPVYSDMLPVHFWTPAGKTGLSGGWERRPWSGEGGCTFLLCRGPDLGF